MRSILLGICILATAGVAIAETGGYCSIGKSDWGDRLAFHFEEKNCGDRGQCWDSSSDMHWERWTGITPEDLTHEGAKLDARLKADAGELRCAGTVTGGELHGVPSFTPNQDFVRRMEAMGFDGLTDDRLQTYTFLDVSLDWVKGMKAARVSGLTAEKLIPLRALKVDPAYVRGMAQCGYPELEADKLVSMKAVGVTPEKVKAVRAMGFSPTKEELIQMAVFKIDAPFVERMKARGFKDPTIAQLVKIKIFKLDE